MGQIPFTQLNAKWPTAKGLENRVVQLSLFRSKCNMEMNLNLLLCCHDSKNNKKLSQGEDRRSTQMFCQHL